MLLFLRSLMERGSAEPVLLQQVAGYRVQEEDMSDSQTSGDVGWKVPASRSVSRLDLLRKLEAGLVTNG